MVISNVSFERKILRTVEGKAFNQERASFIETTLSLAVSMPQVFDISKE